MKNPPANLKKTPSTVGNAGSQKAKRNLKKEETSDDLEEWKKAKQLLKPKDQLELTDAELKEIIPKQLTSTNPQIPEGLIEWSYLQAAFVQLPSPGNMVTVFSQEGTLLHKESEEARQQMVEMGIDPSEFFSSEVTLIPEATPEPSIHEQEPEPEATEEEAAKEEDAESRVTVMEEEEEKGPEPEKQEEPEEADEDEGEIAIEKKAPPKTGGKPRKLTNQFNFCERAALTYNNPTRSQETQTTPPPMASFSANVLQWVIYDAYQADYAVQEQERERERREKMGLPPKIHVKKTPQQLTDEMQGRLFEATKVLERMINQNTYNEMAKDYKYWEDPSDEYREEEGTLLPLWKFTYNKTVKHTVTDLEWNPYYYDLFAVCFGYLDYTKPIADGCLCLFTIKNPSFPDYICMTESAVMCVDIHAKYPYMVVIGLYDGSVQVFNVQATCKEPAYKSNSVTNKHRGIVWEVKWAPDLPDGELNFFSVAGDGKINNWVLMQNDLSVTTITTLYLDQAPVPGPDGTMLKVKACASCVKIHPNKPQIYLVGTEEGLIFKCSVAYSSMYLLTYKAHQLPVYRIDFNRYNTDIFISCSSDWRVKVWEDNRLEPLFVFDVGDRVGDVKWAPYSSTVFACVTSEGKVCVYDLNVNKYKPICVQAIVSKKKNKITRLSFNYKSPIIVIGDDKGCVTTVKLSPNLRIPCKAPKKQQHLDQWTLQCMKLDRLLSLVREPVTLTIPPDTAGSEEQ
ncbi:dynein intermediate chain 2, ciliary [Diabrotica virgifera virgifera]|uniref:Dynein intermediate chain 2, ciliary n=1 Tax=Diabrotica virgifera virgifera TaxID=50390 RepID=A0A6P7FHU2_DIAVI|nr:dynein intermediate chain 2, ciliary [Diabrotica virgifera virgifera]